MRWLGDHIITDAICDRLINSSYRIELNGDTLRKIFKTKELTMQNINLLTGYI